MNELEQVSSLDHQMSLAGGHCRVRSHVREGVGSGEGVMCSEVQSIMGNGHMGPLHLCGQNH